MSEESYTILRPFRHGKEHQFLCLKADQWTARSIELYGEYSESEVDVFRRFIKSDSVCIDAGALFGAHTVAMAELCPQGKVIAFEPQRIPFQMLCANVQINSMANVQAEWAALGDCSAHLPVREAFIPILNPFDSLDHWGMNAISEERGTNDEVVSLFDLYRFVEYHKPGPITFIKIDCEGSEPGILYGAQHTLRQYRPVVYVESNNNLGDNLDMLRAAGYRDFWWHYAVCDREPNYLGRPVPPAIESPVMCLALPRTMVSEHLEWIESNGFQRV